MKQQDATPERPFYSVSYQYKRNPWALYSCNRFGPSQTTMDGTHDLELAKTTAHQCLFQPGVCYAAVSRTPDSYNHETVYECGVYQYGK